MELDDRKYSGLYCIQHPIEEDHQGWIHVFRSKSDAISELFENECNYGEYVLFDPVSNTFFPQPRGTSVPEPTEPSNLRRMWMPTRANASPAAKMKVLASKSTDDYDIFAAARPRLGEMDISEDQSEVRSPTDASSGEQLFSDTDSIELFKDIIREKSASVLADETMEYVPPELLDFQKKEPELFGKSTPPATKSKKTVKPRKKRGRKSHGVSVTSPAAKDMASRNFDSGYCSILPGDTSDSAAKQLDNAVDLETAQDRAISITHLARKDSAVGFNLLPVSAKVDKGKGKESDIEANTSRKVVRACSYSKINADNSFNPSFYSSVRKNKIRSYGILGDGLGYVQGKENEMMQRPSIAKAGRMVSLANTVLDSEFGEPLQDFREDEEEAGGLPERLHWDDAELYG